MKKGDPITYVVNSEGKEFSAKTGKVSEVRDTGTIDLVLDDRSDDRRGRRLAVIFIKPSETPPSDGVFCRAQKSDDLPSTASTTPAESTEIDGNDPDMERDISHIPTNNG